MSSSDHTSLIGRFAAACHADTRIAAAFVGGSRATGTADEYADSDLYLIVRDDAYDAFFVDRRAFMGRLGDSVLLEDFNGFGHDMLLFIYVDGVEGELILARQSNFEHIPSGAFQALLDRDGILPAGEFPPITAPTEDERHEHARWLLDFFWRDLSQLSRWLGRGRLWSAYHHLMMARITCLSLVRAYHGSDEEGYGKIELDVAPEDLAPFQHTFCRVERDAMVEALRGLLAIYWGVAPHVAAAHGLTYPGKLEQAVLRRLEQASGATFDRPGAPRLERATDR